MKKTSCRRERERRTASRAWAPVAVSSGEPDRGRPGTRAGSGRCECVSGSCPWRRRGCSSAHDRVDASRSDSKRHDWPSQGLGGEPVALDQADQEAPPSCARRPRPAASNCWSSVRTAALSASDNRADELLAIEGRTQAHHVRRAAAANSATSSAHGVDLAFDRVAGDRATGPALGTMAPSQTSSSTRTTAAPHARRAHSGAMRNELCAPRWHLRGRPGTARGS